MSERDEGFTLIEVVLAVMLTGMVSAVIAGAILVMFTTTGDTTQRLSESPGLQIASAYFGSDVQSAAVATVGAGTCGAGASLTPLLDLSWTDPGSSPGSTSDDTARTASYFVAGSGNQGRLVRQYCAGGSAPDRTTLTAYVKPGAVPAVTCSATECRIAVTVCTADASNACTADEVPFTLQALRRTS